jgi:general secretion pathway protein L
VADYLFIRFDAAPSDSDACTWVVLDDEGRMIEHVRAGTIHDAATRAGGRRVVLLLPGVEVITTQAELPTTSRARLRQMLPFALEDTLADSVDQLAFGIGPRLPSGAVSASIVARDQLDHWLGLAESAGLTPSAVYSESDGVPDTPSTMNLYVEGNTYYGRRPGQPAFALQGLGLEQAFSVCAATSENEPDVQHAQIFIEAASAKKLSAEIESIRKNLSSLSVRETPQGALPGLAAKLVNDPGTNLLQGDYAPKSNWAAMLRPWRLAAGLLVGLGIAMLLAETVGYLSLRAQDSSLGERIAASCQRQFASTQLSQCEAQVRGRLRSAGQTGSAGGEGFLSTLSAIATLSDNIELEAISYRNRVFDLQLQIPSIPELDAFSQELARTERFDVNIQAANPADNGIDGRIQILEATP